MPKANSKRRGSAAKRLARRVSNHGQVNTLRKMSASVNGRSASLIKTFMRIKGAKVSLSKKQQGALKARMIPYLRDYFKARALTNELLQSKTREIQEGARAVGDGRLLNMGISVLGELQVFEREGILSKGFEHDCRVKAAEL